MDNLMIDNMEYYLISMGGGSIDLDVYKNKKDYSKALKNFSSLNKPKMRNILARYNDLDNNLLAAKPSLDSAETLGKNNLSEILRNSPVPSSQQHIIQVVGQDNGLYEAEQNRFKRNKQNNRENKLAQGMF